MSYLYNLIFGDETFVPPLGVIPEEEEYTQPEMYQYYDITDEVRFRVAKMKINEDIINRVQKNIHIDIENIGQLVCEPINARRERENDYPPEPAYKRFRRGKGRKSAKDTGIQ